MKPRLVIAAAVLLAALLGVGGYLLYQDGLVPVPLAEGRDLYHLASPEDGQDAARLEALMPAGPRLAAFLAAQSDLTPLEKGTAGAWASQLVSALAGSRHGRRWRLAVRPGWRMQDGKMLDAARLGGALAPEVTRAGGEARVVDAMTLDLTFKVRQEAMPENLATWRVPGSGPFVRQGLVLTRFNGFVHGAVGIAELTIVTDPALMDSRAWADGLASGRWAWAVFPGNVAPEDMARVRLSPYDEFRMQDGSVWFLSRRVRRLRPDAADWTRTRLFGIWQGAMDLPFDPLGM